MAKIPRNERTVSDLDDTLETHFDILKEERGH